MRDGDQFRLRRVKARGGAPAPGQRLRVDVACDRNKAGESRPGHALDHRYVDRFRRQRRIEHQVALPAAPQVDVSHVEEKAVPGRVGR